MGQTLVNWKVTALYNTIHFFKKDAYFIVFFWYNLLYILRDTIDLDTRKLQEVVADLQQQLESQKSETKKLLEENKQLREQLALLLYNMYAPKSEKFSNTWLRVLMIGSHVENYNLKRV